MCFKLTKGGYTFSPNVSVASCRFSVSVSSGGPVDQWRKRWTAVEMCVVLAPPPTVRICGWDSERSVVKSNHETGSFNSLTTESREHQRLPGQCVLSVFISGIVFYYKPFVFACLIV